MGNSINANLVIQNNMGNSKKDYLKLVILNKYLHDGLAGHQPIETEWKLLCVFLVEYEIPGNSRQIFV